MLSTTSTAVMALALISSVNAHAVMSTPQPPNFAQLSNAPLGQGINFPCHEGAGYTFDASADANPATAGSNMEVAFAGSAVHGGGVCQFSVTYENPPPKDPSKWKVIHTIVGGCPAQAAGNVQTIGDDGHGHPAGPLCADGAESTGTECVRSFDVPIPAELKNGRAVFAWTWFNKVGNREMYMNCANIEITGGSDDESFFNNLPQMFVANTGDGSSCTTTEGLLDLPALNAGQSVLDNDTPSQGSLGSCAAQGSTGGTPGSGGDDGNTNKPPADEPTPTEPEPSVPSNPGGEFAPSPAPGIPEEPAASAPAPTPETPAPDTPAPETPAPDTPAPDTPALETPAPEIPSNPPAETSPAPPTGSSVACPTDGAIVCMADGSWGLCNHGFAVPQQMAAGMECSNGTMQAMAATKQKKHRRAHRHVRAHARSFK